MKEKIYNLINKFLNDKNDFHKNLKLKALNEYYHYIHALDRKVFFEMVQENLKYFLEFKKIYLAKLLTLWIVIISACLLTLFLVAFFLDYFGFLNINISKPKHKIENVLTVYLPDTDTLAQIECIKRHIKYNLIFLSDPNKNWNAYKRRFQQIEAHGYSDAGSYYARNGEYWGRYQMGEKAREIGNIKDISFKDFTTNPDLQEGCFLAWIRYLKGQMQPEINRYVGSYINGIQITESGIIALAHNIGEDDCRKFLRNNGSTIPPNRVPMLFLKIGGYKLNLE